MKTYLRVLSYAKPYWRHLLISMACTFLFALLNGLSVYLTIPLLDTLFQEGGNSLLSQTQNAQNSFLPQWIVAAKTYLLTVFNNFIFAGDKITALERICVTVFTVYLLKNIFGYGQAYFLAYVEQRLMTDIRNEIYEHLHSLPMSYFKNERVGNLISRIINDTNILQLSISAAFLNVIREPVTIIIFLAMAVSISWQLTLLAFIILPVSVGMIGFIGLKLRRQSGIIQEKVADLTSIVQETVSGVKIVKAFGKEEFENNRFKRETYKFFRMMLKIARTRNLASPFSEIFSVLVGVVIIYYGGKLVLLESALKPSEFLGFLFAIFQMMPPIKELSTVNTRIQESAAAGDRIFEIIDLPPKISDIPHPQSVTSFKDTILFNNVSFRYDDGETDVLKNINLKVQHGDIIALVGPSGGGKSTFVDLLPRFFDITGGDITIDGISIRQLRIADLRGLMGIVTQETILFNDSIKNNIAYGNTTCPLDEVVAAAKLANAHEFIERLPEGYNTVIGERGVKISGGQRQRLSIARALLKNPDIMIFDEATSALDNESEILVQEAIERMMVNRTTFVIAHRLSTIRNATKIIVIDKGTIVQEGTHNELLSMEKGIYKKLYEMQFRDEM